MKTSDDEETAIAIQKYKYIRLDGGIYVTRDQRKAGNAGNSLDRSLKSLGSDVAVSSGELPRCRDV